MKEVKWFLNREARKQGTRKVFTGAFSSRNAAEVRRFHESMPRYRPTPLVRLKNLAGHLGVRDIRVKDESFRFSLGAFKALGASFALSRALAGRLRLPTDELSFSIFLQDAFREQISKITCVTATDGNHGRAVAWLAKQLGCRAVVYMPKGSADVRLRNIQEFGAEVSIIDGNYDDAVRLAEKHAAERDWLLIQDTARPGYEKIPLWVMQGYMTMCDEALEQMEGSMVTHVFVQCGVGSFSGACQAFFAERYGHQRPVFVVVEPVNAACYYASMVKGNGKPHVIKGALNTIMAGLACGEPSPLAWGILRDYADLFISCPDEVTMTGMRVLGNPLAGDQRVISGESGAVTVGLLYDFFKDRNYHAVRDVLGLDESSSVLAFSTEGATDPEMYQKILSGENPLQTL